MCVCMGYFVFPKSNDSTVANSTVSINLQQKDPGEKLQDGRRIRQGDHLPPNKYIRNTSTCGTTPIENLLNAGRRPQTSQKSEPCG